MLYRGPLGIFSEIPTLSDYEEYKN